MARPMPHLRHEEYVAKVAELLVSGETSSGIQHYAKTNNWDVSFRTLGNYIHEAKGFIQAEQTDTRPYRIALADRRLNMIFKNSYDKGNYKIALAAQKEYNALFGLYDKTAAQETGESAFIQLVESAWEARKAETAE